MTDNELTAPLGSGRPAWFRLGGLSPLSAAAGLAGFLIMLLIIWLLVAGDRYGGEPRVIIALAPEGAAPQVLDGGASTGAREEPRLRSSVPPTDLAKTDDASTAASGSDERSSTPITIELPTSQQPQQTTGEQSDEPLMLDEKARATQSSIVALAPVPDPDLVAPGISGPLPVIAPDGRRASNVYARPAPDPQVIAGRARIALIIGGLGLSRRATTNAIENLPPEVSLSFAPYARDLPDWINRARASGHEVLLELPMEPFDYPDNDPGPYTLLTTLPASENMKRLEWLLSRFAGYVGVTNYQGAKFTSSPDALRPVMDTLEARGLLYIDNGASPRSVTRPLAGEAGLPWTAAHVVVDTKQTPESIAAALRALEERAASEGLAVGVGAAFPVTVEQIALWANGLDERGFVLVPASATASDG